MTSIHRRLVELREALVHIENNRLLAYKDITDGDGYAVLEFLRNMIPWITSAQSAQQQLLTWSEGNADSMSRETGSPRSLLLPSRVDLAGFLECIFKAAETGFVTAQRVARHIIGAEAVSELERFSLECLVEKALHAVCSIPILVLKCDSVEGKCPQCQRHNILSVDAAPHDELGRPEEYIECVYCLGKSALRTWQCAPCFALMPIREVKGGTSAPAMNEDRPRHPLAAMAPLLQSLKEEYRIDQAMRWSYQQQGFEAPATFSPDLVLSFLIAYAQRLLTLAEESSKTRLGNWDSEDAVQAKTYAQEAAEVYHYAYRLSALGISAAEGQTWCFHD